MAIKPISAAPQIFPIETRPVEKRLHQRLIEKLERGQTKLDELFPNLQAQKNVDYFLKELDKAFSFPEIEDTKKWLNDCGHSNWQSQLAVFLAKLPLKAAHNIINSLVQLIHGTLHAGLYAAAHPMKAPLQLAKFLLALVHELSKPEIWVKLGSGSIGSTLGYAAVTPTPISPLVVLIGAAMAVTGITARALKAALNAEQGKTLSAVRNNLRHQAPMIAEEMATGLCLGMLIGGIQQMIRGAKQLHQESCYQAELRRLNRQMAKEQGLEFISKHHFPGWDRINWTRENIKLYWELEKAQVFNFPSDLPDASLFMEKVISRYDAIQMVDHYITTTTIDGLTITQPVYRTIFFPVYQDMVGYKFALQGWNPPPPPPPLPPVNDLLNSRVLPAAALTAAHP